MASHIGSLEAAIREALETIVDPCSAVAGAPAGLLTMGLIRRLEIAPEPEGAAVRLTIGVTEPSCLMGAAFVDAARRKVSTVPGVARVEATLDTEHSWIPDDMDATYQARLAARRRIALARAARVRAVAVVAGTRDIALPR